MMMHTDLLQDGIVHVIDRFLSDAKYLYLMIFYELSTKTNNTCIQINITLSSAQFIYSQSQHYGMGNLSFSEICI